MNLIFREHFSQVRPIAGTGYHTAGNCCTWGHLVDLFCNLAAAYPAVVALGGEAVPFLKHEIARKHHKPIAVALLEAIGRDTTARLGGRASQLICPSCLTYCQAHKVCPGGEGWVGRVFEGEIIYYGCRTCSQSRKFLEGRIIAVLDSGMDAELVQQDRAWRVNWLARQSLFDFDEVEILRAIDEDVERLVCLVINDTDEFRRPRYKSMPCRMSADCELCENSRRILANTFRMIHTPPLTLKRQVQKERTLKRSL